MVGNRVLLVDDDVELCELLTDFLAQEGFELDALYDGVMGLERALSEPYELVLLDVMLPGLNGFDVLRRVREKSRVPVMMLTARGDDIDRIVGLEMGADDYLPKPFNPRELVARIRAILRRAESSLPGGERGESPAALTVGEVVLDPSARQVRCGGEQVVLTSVEFSLLERLLQEVGKVVPRDDLSRHVLGRELSSYDRSIDVHISNLRRTLGRGRGERERIQTIRGVGYQYTRPERIADGTR